MKKKLAVLGLAATMMMSLFAGCGGKGSSGGKDASADKGSVYYLNFKPEADAQWQELAKIYEEETGVKVTVVTAASGQYDPLVMNPTISSPGTGEQHLEKRTATSSTPLTTIPQGSGGSQI